MKNESYGTKYPIELVTYFWREVTPAPNTEWIEDMNRAAQQLLPASPFRRIWLYDGWTESVVILAS